MSRSSNLTHDVSIENAFVAKPGVRVRPVIENIFSALFMSSGFRYLRESRQFLIDVLHIRYARYSDSKK